MKKNVGGEELAFYLMYTDNSFKYVMRSEAIFNVNDDSISYNDFVELAETSPENQSDALDSFTTMVEGLTQDVGYIIDEVAINDYGIMNMSEKAIGIEIY